MREARERLGPAGYGGPRLELTFEARCLGRIPPYALSGTKGTRRSAPRGLFWDACWGRPAGQDQAVLGSQVGIPGSTPPIPSPAEVCLDTPRLLPSAWPGNPGGLCPA